MCPTCLGRVCLDPLALADIVRSLRRSRARLAVLVALGELEVATSSEIAVRARISHRHVEGVMIGNMPEFRPAMSLVGLGLVVPRMSHLGHSFGLSAMGRGVLARLEQRELPRFT